MLPLLSLRLLHLESGAKPPSVYETNRIACFMDRPHEMVKGFLERIAEVWLFVFLPRFLQLTSFERVVGFYFICLFRACACV